jgi:hypothetical protein
MRYYFTDHNKLARLLKLNIYIYIHSNQTADTLAPSNADRVEIKATPIFIETGLPQRMPLPSRDDLRNAVERLD